MDWRTRKNGLFIPVHSQRYLPPGAKCSGETGTRSSLPPTTDSCPELTAKKASAFSGTLEEVVARSQIGTTVSVILFLVARFLRPTRPTDSVLLIIAIATIVIIEEID